MRRSSRRRCRCCCCFFRTSSAWNHGSRLNCSSFYFFKPRSRSFFFYTDCIIIFRLFLQCRVAVQESDLKLGSIIFLFLNPRTASKCLRNRRPHTLLCSAPHTNCSHTWKSACLYKVLCFVRSVELYIKFFSLPENKVAAVSVQHALAKRMFYI